MSWLLIWAILGGGLTLGFMLSRRLFALPKFGGTSPADRHRCCDDQSFEVTTDFNHVAGCDLDLGRCASCGTWLMAVYYAGSTTYNVITQERAEYFLELQGTPELRRALKAWVD